MYEGWGLGGCHFPGMEVGSRPLTNGPDSEPAPVCPVAPGWLTGVQQASHHHDQAYETWMSCGWARSVTSILRPFLSPKASTTAASLKSKTEAQYGPVSMPLTSKFPVPPSPRQQRMSLGDT